MSTTPNLRSFARNFGGAAAAAGNEDAPARIPADVWMNVGYESNDVDANGQAITVFIGTPLGIAVDTQKPTDTSKTRSAQLLRTQTKQNNFLAQLQEASKDLQPGEEVLLDLKVQLRRVNGPLEAPVLEDDGFVLRALPQAAAEPELKVAGKAKA